MRDSEVYVIIGVLRRLSEELEKGLEPNEATALIAQELEMGLSMAREGVTKALTSKQLLDGQLVGDLAESGQKKGVIKRYLDMLMH